MKLSAQFVLTAVGLLLAATDAFSADEKSTAAPSMKEKISQLVREEIGPITFEKQPAEPFLRVPLDEVSKDVLALKPFVVRAQRSKDLEPWQESEFDKILRTGVLYEKVGKKTTTQLATKPGRRGLAELGLSFSR